MYVVMVFYVHFFKKRHEPTGKQKYKHIIIPRKMGGSREGSEGESNVFSTAGRAHKHSQIMANVSHSMAKIMAVGRWKFTTSTTHSFIHSPIRCFDASVTCWFPVKHIGAP